MMGKLKDTICYDSPVSYYDHELRAGVDKWEYPERRDNLLLEFTIKEMLPHARFVQIDMRVTREQHDEEFFHGVRWIVFGDESGGFLLSDITPPHEAYQYMLDELDQKLNRVLRNAADEIQRRTAKYMDEITEDAVDNAIYQERNKS